MSKITNDGLTRSGTGCFIDVPYGNSERYKVKPDSPFDGKPVKLFNKFSRCKWRPRGLLRYDSG